MGDARHEHEGHDPAHASPSGRSRLPPMAAGAMLALASAVAFGATTPFIQRFGRGAGPFATAALLYGGAAAFAALASLATVSLPARGAGPRNACAPREGLEPLRASDAPRLALVAVLGAVAAPVALAWGLQRTSGVMASLLLNFEALFTALLARLVWAESIGRRAGVALLVMTCGGALLIAGAPSGQANAAWEPATLGALAVVLATRGWAGDNVVGRPLADRDPGRVVFAKGLLGAAASVVLAVVFGEGWPSARALGALGACGAVGFGASLTLYLRAQRSIGAARTGSVFAAAPFVGAALAWAMGEGAPGAVTLVACALLVAGVWLHLTEAHGHGHTHDPLEHAHAHVHDDQHHDHAHADADAPLAARRHTHVHKHEPTTHTHPHGLDVHHRHRH